MLLVVNEANDAMSSVRGLVCSNHKGDRCAVCGKWPARNNALLCSSCAFGGNRENCIVCGKWPARDGGLVCDLHKGKCVKCGRSL